MYIQVVIKQPLVVESDGIDLHIPHAEVHDTIISDNIEAVKNNFNCVLNRLTAYSDKRQIESIGNNMDFSREWKIDESGYANIRVMIEGKVCLYQFFVRNVQTNFAFYQ